MRRLSVWAAVVIFLAPATAGAELRRAEFKLAGMDCAYCNGAMNKAVGKLDGVESLELSPGRGVTIIRLKADNTITLQQLRRTIKSVGYEAKDAEIMARGRIGSAGTQAALDLLNGSVLRLAAAPAESSDAIVEVTGLVRLSKDGDDILTIATIK